MKNSRYKQGFKAAKNHRHVWLQGRLRQRAAHVRASYLTAYFVFIQHLGTTMARLAST